MSVSSATRWPFTRPVLPRISSGTSGIFLLRHDRGAGAEAVGEIDEAEARAHPQDQLFAEARQVRHHERRAAQNSIAKSRSDTASSEFSHTPSKPSSFATIWRSIGNDVPASAAAPSGSLFTRLRQSASRWRVAREHLEIREQVMGERHRLRDLQVREARHHRLGVLLGEVEQRALQPFDERRAPRRSPRADTAARRSPPGRCASARCAGACRRRRRARSGAARC